MSDRREVLRKVWEVDDDTRTALDDCGPQQNCRNMQLVSFDGMAAPGSDLAAAWRERLAREGKLTPGAVTIRDLVLGDGADPDEQ